MNETDTIVAKGLLFLVAFVVTGFLAQWLLGMTFSELAGTYPFVIYSISAALGVVLGLAAVRHFFPEP